MSITLNTDYVKGYFQGQLKLAGMTEVVIQITEDPSAAQWNIVTAFKPKGSDIYEYMGTTISKQMLVQGSYYAALDLFADQIIAVWGKEASKPSEWVKSGPPAAHEQQKEGDIAYTVDPSGKHSTAWTWSGGEWVLGAPIVKANVHLLKNQSVLAPKPVHTLGEFTEMVILKGNPVSASDNQGNIVYGNTAGSIHFAPKNYDITLSTPVPGTPEPAPDAEPEKLPTMHDLYAGNFTPPKSSESLWGKPSKLPKLNPLGPAASNPTPQTQEYVGYKWKDKHVTQAQYEALNKMVSDPAISIKTVDKYFEAFLKLNGLGKAAAAIQTKKDTKPLKTLFEELNAITIKNPYSTSPISKYFEELKEIEAKKESK